MSFLYNKWQMSLNNAKLQILLAEDNEDFRRLMTIILTSKGHSVVLASDAEQAKNFVLSNLHFDLVISDIGMPGGGGIMLLEFVRKTTPQCKFIVMSGSKLDDQPPSSFRPDEFILKPFRGVDLLKIIDRMFSEGESHDFAQVF